MSSYSSLFFGIYGRKIFCKDFEIKLLPPGNVLLGTDKRTDVWSRDFMIWRINFGLWAVAWAGQWEKRVWADYEKLFRTVFSLFHGKKNFNFFLTPKK